MFCTPWKTLVSISEVLGEIPPLHNIAALFAYRLRYVCRFAIKVGSLDKVVPHSTWAALFVNQYKAWRYYFWKWHAVVVSSRLCFSLSLNQSWGSHCISRGPPPPIDSIRASLATWLIRPLSGYIQTNYTCHPCNHIGDTFDLQQNQFGKF